MASFSVIYDASVLYSAPLRDFLLWLALADLFKARWTDKIHDEWMRNVLLNRPDLTLAQLTRTKNLMNANVRDCLVKVEVLKAANRQLSTLKNPPLTRDKYLDTLIKQGLPQTAQSLREMFDEMPEILDG